MEKKGKCREERKSTAEKSEEEGRVKKKKGRLKRWLSVGLSTALVIGSINLISGLEVPEEQPIYDAPDWTVFLGDEDYDLTDGITYDSDLYDLSITDLGGFDIYVPGDYEVSYELTTKQLSQNTEEQPVTIEDTETPKAAIAGSVSGNEESKDTVVPAGEEDKKDAGGAADAATEAPAAGTTVGSVSGGNAGAVVAAFSRTVSVVIPDTSMYGVATYANTQGKYTVNLGTPFWTDDAHQKFQYPKAKIDTGSEGISLMTITLSNGKLPDAILNDASIRDVTGKSATWFFPNKQSSQDMEQKIRGMIFDYTANMDIYVSVNGNDNVGFSGDISDLKLTQWSQNGHYYLYVPGLLSWTKSYNHALEYKLAGQQGYLVTITEMSEMEYLLNLNNTPTWTAGTRLIRPNGAKLNNDKIETLGPNVLTYINANHTNDSNVARTHFYWAAGPESGQAVTQNLWGGGEPNEYDNNNYVRDTTLGDATRYESCAMVMVESKTLNDVSEGNRDDTYPTLIIQGFFVEFGGYADGQDPGNPDNTKKGEFNEQVQPKDAEATVNGVKYPTLADALDAAKENDVVTIIKADVTAVTGATLKKGVQLKSNGGTFGYTGNVDSVIDVDGTGMVTVVGGSVKATSGVTLNVKSPKDGNTYPITTPQDDTDVIVPDTPGDDQTPYVRNEGTGEHALKIGDVTYTYTNQSADNITMVYIPDAMVDNELVKKAEVAANENASIKVDNTEAVEVKGGGSASEKVTVERKTDGKAQVKLPANTQANAFGHEVAAAPAGGVTISQEDAQSGYPDRDYVIIQTAGQSVTVDNVTYTAETDNQKFYLGDFGVSITCGTGAELEGTQPADPHYLEQYQVQIKPQTNYDLDENNFTVTMEKNDVEGAETLNFRDVCAVDPGTGVVTVTIQKVTGKITIEAGAKRQRTAFTVTGLKDARGKQVGSYTAVDASGNSYTPNENGEIDVLRNEELTLTFTPADFSNPYYADLTGEQGSSFSLLTGLTDTTNAGTDLFNQTVKDSFDWTAKSYTVKYTPTAAANTLAAAFTHSSILHVHVTGGTAEVTGVSQGELLKKEAGAGQYQHVIVPDNGTLTMTLKDTTGHAVVKKGAYWAESISSTPVQGTDVTNALVQGADAQTFTYTTTGVTTSHALNVTFEEGQTVDVTVKNGTLNQTGATWTDKGGNTWQTIVKAQSPLTLKVQATPGYGLANITVNGFKIDAEKALADGTVTYDDATRTYTYTAQAVTQAWTVSVDFEGRHTVQFENQQGTRIGSLEVLSTGTIPAEKFARMQKETDRLKAADETFFAWVDKEDETQAYNTAMVITDATKNPLTLKPLYRKNGAHVVPGADGSVISAADFAIQKKDLAALDEAGAKTLAEVAAFNKDGKDVTAQVTVDAAQLQALKNQPAGIHTEALTFSYNNTKVKVTVEVAEENPTIIGKTAHTLTFLGRGGIAYTVQMSDKDGGNLTGTKKAVTPSPQGKGVAEGLNKGAYYRIHHRAYGQTVGRTSLVDAADIAKQFEDATSGRTEKNGAQDKTEKAWNGNVEVVVDENGNYKVIVKKDINHTIEIPDTWEKVTIDLGGHTIKGTDGDASNAAKPGLDFIQDANAAEHPGTSLEIVNGTIKGGDGSTAHPDGAAGVSTGKAPAPAKAEITVGDKADIIGGNGAAGAAGKGSQNAGNGGNGGAGIEGEITPTVDGGTVSGGSGGAGGSADGTKPGAGGNGGAGIATADKKVTILKGTVKGGDAGNGGNATGDNNKNAGGNGGAGGSGIDSGKGDIVTGPGKTEITGGAGGDGGNSVKGSGGDAGNGGNGAEAQAPGKIDNNGGTINGGQGGNGGSSTSSDGTTGGGKPGAGGKGTEGTTNNTNGGSTGNGGGGEAGRIYAEIFFENQRGELLNKTAPVQVEAKGRIPQADFNRMQAFTDALKAANETFFLWVDKTDATKAYTTETEITAGVTLVPVYRAGGNIITGEDGSIIAADDFIIRLKDVAGLTEAEAKTRANVKAYDKTGKDITATVVVSQEKLAALKNQGEGIYKDGLSFQIPGSAVISITVEITDENPVIVGKTAHTLTFTGRAGITYQYQKLDESGNPAGAVGTITTNAAGKAVIKDLEKAAKYQISHKDYGTATGRTSLVDAADIAKQFEDETSGNTESNNKTDETEKAWNGNVEVVVDENGNYKAIVKKDINHTIEVPDTWENVKVDLNGNTITGDNADQDNPAKPGLDFVKDPAAKEHPGTRLEIVNGTVKGGNGSQENPEGAAGIGTGAGEKKPENAGITVGKDAEVIGGNGADAEKDSGKDGGNGGAGIGGSIETTVEGGSVTGGNGGAGGNSEAEKPGNGGNGGAGITTDKNITINKGTVDGGNGGNGGTATGENRNDGGNGGNGGTGTETGGKTENNGGTISGGDGGNGGESVNGTGGNGGNGGNSSKGETENNGGTENGGNGGNGGGSENGNGGAGGNGGNSENGNGSGGNGGNGGGSENGNGGAGGNGGSAENGTGGNGGNGGNSNKGDGGNGGNGGESENGTGGNGGNGGDSNNGNGYGGNGGNGGNSGTGTGGNGGNGGSSGHQPGDGGNGGAGGKDNGSDGNKGGYDDGNNGGSNGNGSNNGNGGNNGNGNQGSNSGNKGNGSSNGGNGGNRGNSSTVRPVPATDSKDNSKNPSSETGKDGQTTTGTDEKTDADKNESGKTDADTDNKTDADNTGDTAEKTEDIEAGSSNTTGAEDGEITFGECGFHWALILWAVVLLGYTVIRVKKLREDAEQ